MSFILFIAIGGVAGLVARLIVPGKKSAGAFVLAAFLGLLGPVLATFIGRAVGFYAPEESTGLIGAIVGAAILVGVAELISLLIRRTQPPAKPRPATVPAREVTTSPATDVIEKLEALARLRASGAIDDAEFQGLKAEALASGSTPS